MTVETFIAEGPAVINGLDDTLGDASKRARRAYKRTVSGVRAAASVSPARARCRSTSKLTRNRCSASGLVRGAPRRPHSHLQGHRRSRRLCRARRCRQSSPLIGTQDLVERHRRMISHNPIARPSIGRACAVGALALSGVL